MIAASQCEIEIVLAIIKRYVPGCVVLAFGSRYKWTNTDTSDLDLAVVCDGNASNSAIWGMQNEFMESDLPFRVDVVNYNAVSDEFRRIIDEGNEMIYCPRHPA